MIANPLLNLGFLAWWFSNHSFLLVCPLHCWPLHIARVCVELSTADASPCSSSWRACGARLTIKAELDRPSSSVSSSPPRRHPGSWRRGRIAWCWSVSSRREDVKLKRKMSWSCHIALGRIRVPHAWCLCWSIRQVVWSALRQPGHRQVSLRLVSRTCLGHPGPRSFRRPTMPDTIALPKEACGEAVESKSRLRPSSQNLSSVAAKFSLEEGHFSSSASLSSSRIVATVATGSQHCHDVGRSLWPRRSRLKHVCNIYLQICLRSQQDPQLKKANHPSSSTSRVAATNGSGQSLRFILQKCLTILSHFLRHSIRAIWPRGGHLPTSWRNVEHGG